MDAGNYDKTPSEQINLNELLAERIKIFEPKFSGKITFEPDDKESLQNLPKRDFLQVLNILLDNATKYGEKKIVVTLKDHKITVANDGAVVRAEDREKIFDRFYQTDKTKDGSGLGLSIAKTICEQNGWRIECSSQGKMTEFTLGWALL